MRDVPLDHGTQMMRLASIVPTDNGGYRLRYVHVEPVSEIVVEIGPDDVDNPHRNMKVGDVRMMKAWT